MSLILNIDTATEIASISIAKDGITEMEILNTEQKDHGGFLQPAIQTLLSNTHIDIHEIDAIAISAGPGSYTGLRVGMASAKGLAYALNKPLITLCTLEILAYAAVESHIEILSDSCLFCPMIDARRMEVFTALYDNKLQTILKPCALILAENSFANTLLKKQVLFFGNGAKKWSLICHHKNAVFIGPVNNALAMSKLAYQKFGQNNFASIAYTEPFYLKEFFNGAS